jgi:predicted secreted protein
MTLFIHRKHLVLVAACALGAASLPRSAAADPIALKEPEGIVSLNSSATVQVPNDWMTVQFSVTREGTDAAGVQAVLKEALGSALAQAKLVAKPDGHVEVQGGGFSLQPRLNSKGAVTGWTGSTQLWVQGRDMPVIADLAGRISSMTVGSLGYSVSREAREKVEGDVASQAIGRFRGKAAEYAKAFGYTSFVIREVNVQTDGGQPTPVPMYRMKTAMASAPDSSLPVEAGNGSVTTNVNGTVQMR